MGIHWQVVSSERGKTIPNFRTYLESLVVGIEMTAFPLLD